MSMQSYDQLLKPVYDLLKRLELCLEKGFPILPNYLVAVKVKDIEPLIDTIYATLPQEIQEARALLRRRLSESDILKAVQNEAEKIKEQVISECEEIKRRAIEDAENVRLQAADDAMRTRDGANVYVERVFSYLENIFSEQLQTVKNGQVYMDKLKSDVDSNFDPLKNNYPTSQSADLSNNFKLD